MQVTFLYSHACMCSEEIVWCTCMHGYRIHACMASHLYNYVYYTCILSLYIHHVYKSNLHAYIYTKHRPGSGDSCNRLCFTMMKHNQLHACMGNKITTSSSVPFELNCQKTEHPQMLSNWIYYLHLYRIEYGSNY